MDAITALKLRAYELVGDAERLGYNLTIERQPSEPLAMGHTVPWVEVWPLRHPPAPVQLVVNSAMPADAMLLVADGHQPLAERAVLVKGLGST